MKTSRLCAAPLTAECAGRPWIAEASSGMLLSASRGAFPVWLPSIRRDQTNRCLALWPPLNSVTSALCPEKATFRNAGEQTPVYLFEEKKMHLKHPTTFTINWWIKFLAHNYKLTKKPGSRAFLIDSKVFPFPSLPALSFLLSLFYTVCVCVCTCRGTYIRRKTAQGN